MKIDKEKINEFPDTEDETAMLWCGGKWQASHTNSGEKEEDSGQGAGEKCDRRQDDCRRRGEKSTDGREESEIAGGTKG